MNTHNYRLCAAYLQAPGRMWVSVREKHAFPPRGGREDVGQVRGNVRGKQKIWDGRAGEARQEEKIMSKAKRIVLAALLPLLAMACVVLAFFAQAPVTRAQAAGSLTVEWDGETLYAGASYNDIKPHLTVTSDDGSISYTAEEYTIQGSTAEGEQTLEVYLNTDPNTRGEVTITFSPVIPVGLNVSIAEGSQIYSSYSAETLPMFVTGTVTFSNSSTPVAIEQYYDYISVENVDLRPDKDSDIIAGGTYKKQIYVSFSMNGTKITTQDPITIEVIADELTSINVSCPNRVFDALSGVPSGRLTVTANYAYGGSRTLAEGEYEIDYLNAEDHFVYGDTSFDVVYKEGAQSAKATVRPITVRAYPIAAPRPDIQGNVIYIANAQSRTFSVFNSDAMEYELTGTGISERVSGESLVISATEVGEYSVKFTVKEGYAWIKDPLPSGAEVEWSGTPGGANSTIISFTYRWQITKATLTGVSFDIEEEWTYKDTGKGPTGLTLTSAIESNVSAEGATVTYTYKSTDSYGYSGNTLPTDAGAYRVRVTVSNLKNYQDITSGWTAFTISPRSVELPTLQEGTASVPYTGRGQSPTVKDNYQFEAASNAYTTSNPKQVNAGNYEVTFTLTNTRNYVWAEEFNGSLAWKITTADNVLEDIEISGWTFDPAHPGQTNEPTATFKFTNVDVNPTYYYSYRAFGETEYKPFSPVDGQWPAGEYKVWASYPADKSGHNNFNAYAANEEDGEKYTFTVKRFSLTKPTALTQKEFTYQRGTTVNISDYIPQYDEYKGYYTLQGTYSAENAGKYTVTIVLNGNYNWTGGGTENVPFDWTILRAVIPVPTMDESETKYSGSVQTKNVSGYQSGIMTSAIGGNGSGAAFDEVSSFTAKNFGDYTLTVSFEGDNAKNYYWAGGSSDPTVAPGTVKLTWNIAKAQAVIDGTPSVDNWTYDTKAGTPEGADPDTATSGFEGVVAYYAWSTSADGEYKEWKEGKEGNIPVNAGVYYLKYIIDGTNNFVGAATSAVPFKVLRETVAKPTFADGSSVYDGDPKTSTVSGYIADRMTYTTDDVADDAVSGTTITLTATYYNEGGYYIEFTLKDAVNYTWSDSSTDPEDDAAQPVRFEWAISKADNEVLTTDTFNGWIFGEEASATSDLGATAKYDGIEVTFAVYKAGEVGTGEEQTISNDLAAGSYVLRASIAAGANTNAAYEEFEFTVTPNTGATVTAEFADVTEWTYGDKPHAFTAKVTVGTLTYGNAAVTVEYFTSGWNAEGDWTSLGNSLTEAANAGYYYAQVTINANGNYSGEAITVKFTIK